ncbi:MAG: hypothetical protein A2Y97_02385 [Nitrospirae bacterium RBG_13_39_12]|nr:MAG: hypothetical protein A2Y97_02385 [Nitrospirae bacterium RBG_13_39_12]
MTDNPLVSIIVRTKDRPELLKRALQSIAVQDYRPIEVVLVNDGAAIFDPVFFAEKMQDIPLKYLNNDLRGRTAAANLGLKNCGGEFVCFLDDDDIFYSDHVSTLSCFLKESDYKIAYTESYFVHSEYDPVNRKIIQTKKYPAQTMDFSKETLIFYNYIPFMCLMFKRDVLGSVGGFDEEFEMCEDWDLTIRLAEKYPFYHINKFTSEYNIWSRNTQSILNDEQLLFFRKKLFAKNINKITPSILAKFIFNGYWVNLKYMEDRINCLENEILKMQKETDGLMEGKERIWEENQRLWEETQRLREEKQKVENKISQLENYINTNTIKVPKKMKSVLRSLIKNKVIL